MEKIRTVEYFEEAETEQEYNGDYYSVAEVISIMVMRSLPQLEDG